jgi:hypothetical protein
MTFNEDSRVKIPAIQHLCYLGYEYLSLSKMSWDKDTNKFPSLFEQAMEKLNPGQSSKIRNKKWAVKHHKPIVFSGAAVRHLSRCKTLQTLF